MTKSSETKTFDVSELMEKRYTELLVLSTDRYRMLQKRNNITIQIDKVTLQTSIYSLSSVSQQDYNMIEQFIVQSINM